MKKLLLVCVALLCAGVGSARDLEFVARDAQNGYGYRQYIVPIGVTVLPWTFPNFESSVYGFRVNLGWGRYAKTYGIDGGVCSFGKETAGLAGNLICNVAEDDVYGVQIGGVNYAGHLHGLQIGFLNFNRAGIAFPLINIGF